MTIFFSVFNELTTFLRFSLYAFIGCAVQGIHFISLDHFALLRLLLVHYRQQFIEIYLGFGE